MTRVSLRYDLRLPPSAHDRRGELYATALEQAAWADRLGLDAVIVSEHHGNPDGCLPSPLVFAGALAARTDRIAILIAALVVPLHDPLRLVEDLLVLDHLSGGRVAPVVGAGYVPSEFALFDRELETRPQAVEEFVRVLRAAWTGEPFDFRGRTARLTPPAGSDHPFVLLGGSTPGGARRAARLGDGFIPERPELWEPYRREVKRLGRPDPGPPPVAGPRFLHLSDEPERAWEEIGPYLLHEANAYAALAEEAGRDTGYTRTSDVDDLRAHEDYEILTPDDGIALARDLGENGALGLHPLCGGMPPELSWPSLRLLEERVLPALGAEG